MNVLIRGARVLTLAGPTHQARRGAELGNLRALECADVMVSNGVIERVEPRALPYCPAGAPRPREAPRPADGLTIIEARGRVLMPGFIDAHTHALWAGSRVDEWQRRLAGESYLDILKGGGGIMSTVRAVRAASEAELSASLSARLRRMLREGTTTVEVKSGYGLSTECELKMLRVITGLARRADPSLPTIIPTALLGHAIDASETGFVQRVIEQTLPAVSAEFPGITIDAFCEQGAWTLDDCKGLFELAMERGHPCRVHADQFNALGMTAWAVKNRFVSVDHLEATSPDGLAALAESGTFGVMLPVCGFHTDGRYAEARRFVDAGGALVLATNCNPGSAPCTSMPLAIALAARNMRLTPHEAVAACTANAAALLGLFDRGVIEPGRVADLVLLCHTDERELAHHVGGCPIDAVIARGELVHGAMP